MGPGLFSKSVTEGSLSPTAAGAMELIWNLRLKVQFKDLKTEARTAEIMSEMTNR